MKYFKHFLILTTFVVLSFVNKSFAAVSETDATNLFFTMDSILKYHIEGAQEIDFVLIIKDDKKPPGAFAKWEKVKKSAQITITSSLLELEQLDDRALALFLCHEFGHFLGGKPYVKPKKSEDTIHSFRNIYKYMSPEGQADYFATKECLPHIFAAMMWRDNTFHDSSLFVCELSKRYPSDVCYALVNTVKKTTDIYQTIAKEYFQLDEKYSPLLRSKSQVNESILEAGKYPSLQCRFDTMMAGLNTAIDFVMERPSCWYKAEEE